MPKLKEELQFAPLIAVMKPKEGASIYYNPDDRALKLLHSNGVLETLSTGSTGTGESANIDDTTISTTTTYSSSKITDYVGSKVAELVNSAPSTLDTLKELSDALGGDPNFATTVTTQIGGKQDKLTAGTGITITDNVISATGGTGTANIKFRVWG